VRHRTVQYSTVQYSSSTVEYAPSGGEGLSLKEAGVGPCVRGDDGSRGHGGIGGGSGGVRSGGGWGGGEGGLALRRVRPRWLVRSISPWSLPNRGQETKDLFSLLY